MVEWSGTKVARKRALEPIDQTQIVIGLYFFFRSTGAAGLVCWLMQRAIMITVCACVCVHSQEFHSNIGSGWEWVRWGTRATKQQAECNNKQEHKRKTDDLSVRGCDGQEKRRQKNLSKKNSKATELQMVKRDVGSIERCHFVHTLFQYWFGWTPHLMNCKRGRYSCHNKYCIAPARALCAWKQPWNIITIIINTWRSQHTLQSSRADWTVKRTNNNIRS